MYMNVNFEVCLKAAQRIVAAEKSLWPHSEGVMCGGSVEQREEKFERTGTSELQRLYELPAQLANLLTQNYTQPTVPSTLSDAELGFLDGLFSRNANDVPGSGLLQNVLSLPTGGYTGESALQALIANSGTNYEDATRALYERSFDKAKAAMQSGPASVRGAAGRQGIGLSELGTDMSLNRFREVDQRARQQDALVSGAVQLANAIESARRGTSLQAQTQLAGSVGDREGRMLGATQPMAGLRGTNLQNLTLASEVLGSPKSKTTENLRGAGSQFGWQMGTQLCCFIFLEALNGVLPEYVRRGRDEFCTPRRRSGYVRMAQWLVPLMQRFSFVKHAVNEVMVKPFLRFGEWHYARRGAGWLWKPLCYCWFGCWDILGKDC
jgi:hypothetical protein